MIKSCREVVTRFLFGSEEEKEDGLFVLFGSYPIRGKPPIDSFIPPNTIHHFAVHYNSRRYEIDGNKERGQNIVTSTYDSVGSFTSDFMVVIKYEVKRTEQYLIEDFISYWQNKHPNYSYYQSSCQDFVRDILKEVLDVKIKTQSDHIKDWATAVLNAAMIVSALLVILLVILLTVYFALSIWAWRTEKNEKYL